MGKNPNNHQITPATHISQWWCLCRSANAIASHLCTTPGPLLATHTRTPESQAWLCSWAQRPFCEAGGRVESTTGPSGSSSPKAFALACGDGPDMEEAGLGDQERQSETVLPHLKQNQVKKFLEKEQLLISHLSSTHLECKPQSHCLNPTFSLSLVTPSRWLPPVLGSAQRSGRGGYSHPDTQRTFTKLSPNYR